MDRVGIIDIGANSVKLILCEIDDSGFYKVIDELTSSVRLCYDLIDSDVLSEERIQAVLATLKTYKSLCTVAGAKEIIAVGTDSVRLAKNKDYLLSLLEEELQLKVRELTPEEEIKYIFLGVTNSMYIKNSLIVDIGGSTTYLIWVKDGEIKERASIPYGTVNLTYKHNLRDRILKSDLDAAVSELSDALVNLNWLRESNFDSIVGVGGTFRALGKINRIKTRYMFDICHYYYLTDIDFSNVFSLLKAKDLKLRRKVEGLSFERADLIIGGLTIFNTINTISSNHLTYISGCGLREGLMYEYIHDNYDAIKDPLDYNIYGIMNNLNINITHAKQVYGISLKLFEALKPLHKYDDSLIKVIKTAALLHDCGSSIDYINHHRHSFYIIMNSNMKGLTHRELLISAAIAASHRNNKYHLPLAQFCSLINKFDIMIIEKLGTILRISEGLDRSLEGAVKDIEVKIEGDKVNIELTSELDLTLEIHQAMRAACKFQDVYNKKLIISKKNIF